MVEDSTKPLSKVIRIDESQIRDHLGEMVRDTVEATLNGLLEAEADALCGAQRYEHSADRIDTRAGHYPHKLHTKAGESAPIDATRKRRVYRRFNRRGPQL